MLVMIVGMMESAGSLTGDVFSWIILMEEVLLICVRKVVMVPWRAIISPTQVRLERNYNSSVLIVTGLKGIVTTRYAVGEKGLCDEKTQQEDGLMVRAATIPDYQFSPQSVVATRKVLPNGHCSSSAVGAHYWLIEECHSPTSMGVCKYCGKAMEFSNWLGEEFKR